MLLYFEVISQAELKNIDKHAQNGEKSSYMTKETTIIFISYL